VRIVIQFQLTQSTKTDSNRNEGSTAQQLPGLVSPQRRRHRRPGRSKRKGSVDYLFNQRKRNKILVQNDEQQEEEKGINNCIQD